ncbi:MAG: hypothetical protein ACREV4_10235 [Gammaproteobacteria bacterium]
MELIRDRVQQIGEQYSDDEGEQDVPYRIEKKDRQDDKTNPKD